MKFKAPHPLNLIAPLVMRLWRQYGVAGKRRASDASFSGGGWGQQRMCSSVLAPRIELRQVGYIELNGQDKDGIYSKLGGFFQTARRAYDLLTGLVRKVWSLKRCSF